MTDDLGDVSYAGKEELICGAPFGEWKNNISPKTQIILTDKSFEEKDDETKNKLTSTA